MEAKNLLLQISWHQVKIEYCRTYSISFQNADLCTRLFHIRSYFNIGIILTIVHSMALGYSAMIIIIERNEGLLDRTWVAGVTPAEFSLAHFLVSLVVNLLQVC